MIDTMIVIAKEPIAGRVKTRLVPPLSFEQAASLAAASLSDTLRIAARVPARNHVLVLDGAPGNWLPPGWLVLPQVAGELDQRLVAAFDSAGSGSALLIGMDTPQLQVGQLTAFDPDAYDACIGLAPDGGYWAIGFRSARASAESISGVPMSTFCTGAIQLLRLQTAGLKVQLLDDVCDIDTYDDALAIATRHPGTEFAAEFRGLNLLAAR